MTSRRAFLFIAATSMAGCGFKLRGAGDPVGSLPEMLIIRTVDPFASIIKSIKRQLISEGCDVVETGNVPILTVSGIQSSKRVLGPVTGGDQTELILEISYGLVDTNLVTIIPKTPIRASLIYVDTGLETSADDSRLTQFKRGLERDLLQQIVPSLRIRYDQARKQNKLSE